MRRATGARLAVALLAVVALGVSATTIESTMETDANEVIDLDYDRVPIDSDDGTAILAEIEGTDGDSESERELAEDGSPNPDREVSEGEGEGATGFEEADATREAQRASGEDENAGPGEQSLLDRLLALLAQLVPVLLALLALLVTAGLAYRYRERLLARLSGDDQPDDVGSAPEAPAEWAAREPANAVDRAWAAMVRRLDPDRPATMTPEECARAAVEAGFDADAVRTLTETFEEVRYGDRPVTDDRERAAERSRRRLDDGGDRA